MSRGLEAAIIHAKEICLAPIPAGMGSHGQPEIAGAAENGRGKQSENAGSNNSYTRFAAVAHMYASESQSHNESGRPEPDTLYQSMQGVPAKCVLFKEA